MKKNILFVVLTLILINYSFGQEILIDSIQSDILKEKRGLKIQLPHDYNEGEVYPVIYITDGESNNFDIAKNYLNMLSEPVSDIIPSCILVGIIQKDRSKELRAFGGGDGKKFSDFINNELLRHIDSVYQTSGFNLMIGHSDGAEFNHTLLTSINNPFRGFISMSTSFHDNMRNNIFLFLKEYNGPSMYYFLANGSRDMSLRIDAGNELDSLFQIANNKNIKFAKRSYPADHSGLVSRSLLDGLAFIFQDYKNMDNYNTIMEYGENYLVDLENNYGLKGSFSLYDLEKFYDNMFDNKKIDEYHYWVSLVNKHKLAFGSEIDPLNRALHYYELEMYPESIDWFNKAITEIETIGASYFYQKISTARNVYIHENRVSDYIDFLILSK